MAKKKFYQFTKPRIYLGGKEYIRYTVKSLSGDDAELTMSMDGESMDIKAEKR